VSTRRLGLIGGKLGLFVTLVVGVVVAAVVMALVLNGTAGDDPGFVASASVSLEGEGDGTVTVASNSEPGVEETAREVNTDAAGELDDPERTVGDESSGEEVDEAASSGAGVADPVSEPAPDDAEARTTGDEPAPDFGASEGVDLGPRVEVSPSVIRQGETVFVRLFGAEAGSVLLTVDGATTSMVEEGETWVGFVPIAPLSFVGGYTVIVDWFDADDVYTNTALSEFQVVDAGVPVEQITLIPGDEGLLAPNLVAIDINVRFGENAFVSGPRLWTGPWMAPLPGVDTGIFGALRSYNGAVPSDWHHGHDFDGETGDPIVAAATGRVAFVGELPIHGIGVILDHGAGVFSGYWHMSESMVDVGTLVLGGNVLGAVGTTGLVVGAHLHWEVIVRGQDVDPVQWLTASLHP
jgi:hypothetical protein